MNVDYLAGQPVLVVGDGPLAFRRACTYHEAGAQVCVITRSGSWAFEPDYLGRLAGTLGVAQHVLHDAAATHALDIEMLASHELTRGGRALRSVNGERGAAMQAHPAGTGLNWESLLGTAWLVDIATTDADLAQTWQSRAEELSRPVLISTSPDTAQITLVGGGPGSAELLTVAGQRALADADVVFVDRLGPGSTAAAHAPGALIIDVGKVPGHHKIPQAQIESLMVHYAANGARVVRLKGGDPFVFGRGAEELATAAAENFTIASIPGITSAISVPAVVGIPVTHRDVTRAFTVISGHQPLSDTECAGLVATGGTIVILMGVANIPNIAAGLLRHGLAPSTPVSIIENGYTETQREVRCALSEMPTTAALARVNNPAVIVIGEVVNQAQKQGVQSQAEEQQVQDARAPRLSSAENPTENNTENNTENPAENLADKNTDLSDDNSNLTGIRIAVTADRRSGDQIAAFERRGATVTHAPTMRIVPITDDPQLAQDSADIVHWNPDFVLVTTAQGFKGWHELAAGPEFDATMQHANIVVRGPKARGGVRGLGFTDAGIAHDETTASLIDLTLAQAAELTAAQGRPARIAMQLHGYTDTEQLRRVTAAGHELKTVAPYRWAASPQPEAVQSLIHDIVQREVHVVTFTAAPAAASLLKTARELGLYHEVVQAFQHDVTAAAVGNVTAAPLLDHGITPVYPERYRMGALIKEVCRVVHERYVTRGHLAGQAVALHGATLVRGHEQVVLAPVSASVMKILLREGSVSRPTLAAELHLSGGSSDREAALELALNRLMRSVGHTSMTVTDTLITLH